MVNTEKLAFTVDEFAAAYGIGRTKVYELINTAGFPAVRLGRRVIIPIDMLKQWFAKQPTVANGLPFSAAG